MSTRETPLTRWYWRQVGGTLIEEFPAVVRTNENAPRWIDGVIIRGGEHRIARANEVDLTDRDIIVVQTKDSRLGMYLLGQAFFSAHLMMKFKPRTIQSVALCRENDAILGPIFESYPNMKVVICPEDVWGPEL
ncbi:MAG: hypothetical protein ACK526_07830 [Planctomyces sp.]